MGYSKPGAWSKDTPEFQTPCCSGTLSPGNPMSPETVVSAPQLLTENDLYLFNEGSDYRIYDKMGAHLFNHEGQAGAIFSVWAPNARSVSVIGNFNGWDPKTHRLRSRGSSGIWEGFVPSASQGSLYKFHIDSNRHGYRVDKTD